MNIWEAVGVCFVLLMACFGTYTVLWFAYRGIKATEGQIEASRQLVETCRFCLDVIESHMPELHDGAMATRLRAAIGKTTREVRG